LYYASPVAAADKVYFASGDGVLTVVRAGDKLEVLARNDIGEPMFATPSFVDGKIYVRTTSRLYAFESAK
jgi:outer membrane protein assembly factor BamB